MSLTLRFLGTAASRPTVERNVVSLAIVREGDTFLFDCGEGTQRQMMRYGISFNVGDIFFSHFHADHWLGIIGLLQTMGLQGRTEPLRIWGPRGATRMMRKVESIGVERLGFDVATTDLEPGEAVRRKGFAITPYAASHRGAAAVGWILAEEERLGRFDPERAEALGIPHGPMRGLLHRGQPVTLDDGRVVQPSELVGPTRPGRRVVYTGDTRPCDATIEAARGADVLVHEATFSDEEADRARDTGHSTAREAAGIAAAAGARRLLLTHISARYSRDAGELDREAKRVFPATTVARDGMEVEVPYADEGGEGVKE